MEIGSGRIYTKHYDFWLIHSIIKTILCLIFLLPSKGLSQLEYNLEDLVESDGFLYKKFGDTAIDGLVYKLRGSSKIYLGMMKNGLPNETWLFWCDGDRKKEAETKHCSISGSYTGYDNQGTVRLMGQYADGKKIGVWTAFSKDGTVKNQFNYEKGIIVDGTIRTVNDQGYRCKEKVWEEGQLKEIRWYTEFGTALDRVEDCASGGCG